MEISIPIVLLYLERISLSMSSNTGRMALMIWRTVHLVGKGKENLNEYITYPKATNIIKNVCPLDGESDFPRSSRGRSGGLSITDVYNKQ